jgi:hypothetical protein
MDRPTPARAIPLPEPSLHRTRWWLGAAFALHAVLGAAVGLSVDEAHYALYAQHLALSYFDHPPLVGWLQWPLVALHAPEAVLRLLPGVLWLATVWLAHGIALRLQGLARAAPDAGAAANAGLWTVVALLLAPVLHLLAIGLLPDTLLMFFTVAVMALALRILGQGGAVSARQWLALGLLLGLAGLSKYTAVFLAPALLWCLLAVRGWAGLRSPWAVLSLLLALVVVSPVLVWNAQNQWVSFAYQAGHGAGGAWQWDHLVRYLLLQLLAYGPLLWWGFAGWLRTAPRGQRLGGFFAIPWLVLVAMSGGGSGLPHWTAPAWVALSPFAGVALAHAWGQGGGRRALLRALVALQAAGCAALLGMMVSGGAPWLAGGTVPPAANAAPASNHAEATGSHAAQTPASNPSGGATASTHATTTNTNTNTSTSTSTTPNPFADLHGWDAAAARAQQLAKERGLTSAAVQNWTLASRLAWYARPLPVHVLQDRFDQFDFWAGKLPSGASTLLVDWSQQPYAPPLGTPGFARCERLETLAVQRFGYHLAQFDFYACFGWSGMPGSQLQLQPQPQPQPAARVTP